MSTHVSTRYSTLKYPRSTPGHRLGRQSFPQYPSTSVLPDSVLTPSECPCEYPLSAPVSTRSVGQAQVLQIALTSADAAERAAVDALFEALLRADADTQLLLAVSGKAFSQVGLGHAGSPQHRPSCASGQSLRLRLGGSAPWWE